MTKNIALIPARGGSKGIPKKNLLQIFGKPMISYAINASLESNVSETWVSTDDEQIKKISIDYGSKVIDRPEKFSLDNSPSEEALLHFANSVYFDNLIFIQPTSPLILSHDINKCIEMMGKYDSVFSAYLEHWLPRWNKDIKPVNWNIKHRPMRQNIDENYVENGAIYITSRKNLLQSRLRYSGKIGIYEMPLYRSFQVDTLEDLRIIKNIMKRNDNIC